MKYFFIFSMLFCNNLAAFFPTQELPRDCNLHLKNKFGISELSLKNEYQFLAKMLLENMKTTEFIGFTADEFKIALQNTEISELKSTDLKLDGYLVDAINYPNCNVISDTKHKSLCKNSRHLIIINSKNWLLKNFDKKIENVLHEFLGILGKEKNVFVVTHKNKKLISKTRQYINEKYNTFSIYPLQIETYRGMLYICRENQKNTHVIRYWLNSDNKQFPYEVANGYYIHMKTKLTGEISGFADIGTTYEHRLFTNEILGWYRIFNQQMDQLELNLPANISRFRRNMLFEGIVCRAKLLEDCPFPYGIHETQIIEAALK